MCVCCSLSIQQIPEKIHLQPAVFISIILQALIMYLHHNMYLHTQLSMRYGSYYANGHIFYCGFYLGFRFQPYVNISLNTNYNNLILPQPWGNVHFWLDWPAHRCNLYQHAFFYNIHSI